jgi:hypothetical protein
MYLSDHAPDLRRILVFDYMVETLESKRLDRPFVAFGASDCAPDPLDTEFRHDASPP